MKIEQKLPWSVCMVDGQFENFEGRMAKLNGCRQGLTAPTVRIGAVLRPSIIGSTKSTIKTPATVTIDHHPTASNIIGLEFSENTSAYVGRPVFGHNGDSKFESTFGDEEGIDVGFKRIEAVTNPSGESVMVGYRLNDCPKILSGLTYVEVTGFILGCMSAVEKHRKNKTQN